MKATAYIVAICCCIIAISLRSSCGRTGEQEFADNVRLRLSASDRYDLAKTAFYLEFSTVGDQTIYPGRRSPLVLFVDGKEKPPPAHANWDHYMVRADHILPNRPRASVRWMTLPELTDWLGPGEHELQFQFRNVKSNVLKVTVPAEGAEGRVKCDPELDVPGWTKER